MANCTKCGCEIVWLAHKTTGRPAPIELVPSSFGNILVHQDQYRIATPEEIEKAKQIGKSLYLNHFASCAYAQEFKKDKK